MSKRLKDNLSSGYFEAANRMTSKKARRRIVAYVESYDDVFFWRSVLSRFEDSTRYFEVMLPSRVPHLERGKKAALMSLLNGKVGRDMIACVDADYDYLIQRATPMSETIIDSPYIFHTYAYSIENLQCYAPSLHDVCVGVTLNDHAIFDFVSYFREYSLAIFPLFVWSVWFYRTPHYTEFTISDFLHVIETGHFNPYDTEGSLRNLRRKVARRVTQLQRHYPSAKKNWQEVKDDIKSLGVTPETTYLYVQGHHLFDKVVVPMLKKICNMLVRERENEISRQSVHPTQRNNELSCYSGSVADVELMLKKNIAFTSSAPCGRMMDDIRRFLGDEPSADTERKEYSDKNVPGKDGATAAETHTDGV